MIVRLAKDGDIGTIRYKSGRERSGEKTQKHANVHKMPLLPWFQAMPEKADQLEYGYKFPSVQTLLATISILDLY